MRAALSVSEIGPRESRNGRLLLKEQRVKDGSHDTVSGGTLVRAVLEPAVSQDHMRTNHAFGVIVVAGQSREIQEGEHFFLMFEATGRESLPIFIRIRSCGKEKEPLFESANLAHKSELGQLPLHLLQAIGVAQDALELFAGSLEVGWRILPPALPHLPQQMHQTFLLSAVQFVVSGIEIADHNSRERVPQQIFGNFGTPAPVNLVIGEFLIHKRPEPVIRSVDLPARFIHMHVGAGSNRILNRLRFHVQPLPHPLQSLGNGPFRNFQSAKHLEKLDDLVPRQSVVILEHRHLHESQRPQVSAGHFPGSIRRAHHLLALLAPIPMPFKFRHFHPARHDVFLNMLHHALACAQSFLTIRTAMQSLLDFTIELIGSWTSASWVAGFAAPLGRRLATFLGEVLGFLGRERNFLLQVLKLFTKFGVLLAKLENLVNQNFFFLQKEYGCVQLTGILLCPS